MSGRCHWQFSHWGNLLRRNILILPGCRLQVSARTLFIIFFTLSEQYLELTAARHTHNLDFESSDSIQKFLTTLEYQECYQSNHIWGKCDLFDENIMKRDLNIIYEPEERKCNLICVKTFTASCYQSVLSFYETITEIERLLLRRYLHKKQMFANIL